MDKIIKLHISLELFVKRSQVKWDWEYFTSTEKAKLKMLNSLSSFKQKTFIIHSVLQDAVNIL